MFDASFLELLVVFIVALLVLGPERLPKVARTLGFWIGRARGAFNAVKADVEREMQLQEVRQAGREIEESLRRNAQAAEGSVRQIAAEASDLAADRTIPSTAEPVTDQLPASAPAAPEPDPQTPEPTLRQEPPRS